MLIKNINKSLSFREKLLLLYIAFMPIMKTFSLPNLKEKLQFSEIIFLGIIICCFKDLSKIMKFLFTQFEFKVFCIFLLVTLSSLTKSYLSFNGFIEYIQIIYLFLALFLFIYLIQNSRVLILTIKVWVITAASVAALGFFALCFSHFTKQFYGNPFVSYETTMSSIIFFPRIISTFRNSNMLLTYLHISLGLTIFLVMIEKNMMNKRILKLAATILLMNILFTGSRLIVGVILTLLIISFSIKNENRKHNYSLNCILVFLFTGFLMFALLCTRWTVYPVKIEKIDATKQLNISLTYADSIYHIQHLAALKMIKEHPFKGVGFGEFINKLPDYVDWNKYDITLMVEKMDKFFHLDPHSTYLGIFAETGFFGLVSLLFIFYFILKNCLLVYKIYKNDLTYRYMSISALAVLAGFLLNAFFIDIMNMRHLWIFMALLIAMKNILEKEKRTITKD